MEKEFVTYELAGKLKALGFDEPCCAFYQVEYAESRPTMVDDDNQYRLTGYRTCKNSEIPEHYTSAPTFSQAFRWFREKYDLFTHIEKGENPKNFYPIIDNVSHKYNPKLWFDTYEETELACLEKLIEVVETKWE